MTDYLQFVSVMMKKRPEGTMAKEWMREIGKKWQEQKQKGGAVKTAPALTTRKETSKKIATKLKKNETVVKNKTPTKIVLQTIKKQSSSPKWAELGKKIAIELAEKASYKALEKYGLSNFVTRTLVEYIVPFVVSEMYDYIASSKKTGKGMKDFPYTPLKDLQTLIDDVIDEMDLSSGGSLGIYKPRKKLYNPYEIKIPRPTPMYREVFEV